MLISLVPSKQDPEGIYPGPGGEKHHCRESAPPVNSGVKDCLSKHYSQCGAITFYIKRWVKNEIVSIKAMNVTKQKKKEKIDSRIENAKFLYVKKNPQTKL